MHELQNFIDKYLVGFLALIVGGIFALFGYLNPKARERSKELNSEEDRLLELRKQRAEELAQKVDTLQSLGEEQTKQLAELTVKYEVITAVFQGRDEDSTKYRAEGRATMKIVAEGAAKLDAVKAQIEQHNIESIAFRKQHGQEIQRLYEAIQANTAKVGKIAEELTKEK